MAKSKSRSSKRRSSVPVGKRTKKARARRGFANVAAFSSIVPAGIGTQTIGGVAGFVGTGMAVAAIESRARQNPDSMLAKLSANPIAPPLVRAAIALAAGWALRRFVSRPIGNAVAVGGLINAGGTAVSRMMATWGGGWKPGSGELLGIGDPAGIDVLHPERDTSLGQLSDADIQRVLEAARSDSGMGEIAGNIDEANLTPAAVDQIIRAA